jgi:hypothetical protein
MSLSYRRFHAALLRITPVALSTFATSANVLKLAACSLEAGLVEGALLSSQMFGAVLKS